MFNRQQPLTGLHLNINLVAAFPFQFPIIKKAITHPRQQPCFPSSLIHALKNEQDPSVDQEAIFTQEDQIYDAIDVELC